MCFIEENRPVLVKHGILNILTKLLANKKKVHLRLSVVTSIFHIIQENGISLITINVIIFYWIRYNEVIINIDIINFITNCIIILYIYKWKINYKI